MWDHALLDEGRPIMSRARRFFRRRLARKVAEAAAFLLLAVYGVFTWWVLTVLAVVAIFMCALDVRRMFEGLRIQRNWANTVFEQRRLRSEWHREKGEWPSKRIFIIPKARRS